MNVFINNEFEVLFFGWLLLAIFFVVYLVFILLKILNSKKKLTQEIISPLVEPSIFEPNFPEFNNIQYGDTSAITGSISRPDSGFQPSVLPPLTQVVNIPNTDKVPEAIKPKFNIIEAIKNPFDINYLAKHKEKKKMWIIRNILISLLLVGMISYLFFNLFYSYPKMGTYYPEWDGYWNNYDEPISVSFNRPIDTKSLVLNISPNTSGTWVFEKSIPYLPFSRRLKFYPNETVYPGNKVIVYFTHVTNFFNTIDNREEFIQFNSVDMPTVLSSTPVDKSVDIRPDSPVEFTLSHKDGEYVDWEIDSNTEDTYKINRNNTNILKVEFNEKLKQNTDYKFELFQVPLAKDTATGEITKKGDRKKVYDLGFKTVSVPLVKSITPQGGNVLVDANIRVEFELPMDHQSVESNFSFSPNTSGTKSWEGDNVFVFKPEVLNKETRYSAVIKKGISSLAGGISEDDIVFSFSTIGKVDVVGWTPKSNINSAPINSSLNVTFNQAVDHGSAESKFSVNPSINGSFAWQGNTLKFVPAEPLKYLTKYSVNIDAGIVSINGINSQQAFGSVFTTEPKKVELNVPLYRQKNSKECQIVATQMVMGFKGVGKDKMQIFNEFPKDATVCNAENNTWGNPNVGFVGEINGNHDCASGHRGYGVYWNPVSSYLSSRGVSNKIVRGSSVSALAKELESGHPAIVWWQNGWSTPNDVSWSTPEGQSIYAVNGMHSEVVVGYIGTVDNPTHMILNDPWRGRRTLEVGYFNSLWGYFGRTAVVIL